MNFRIILLFFFFNLSLSVAQTPDTLYYNADWNPTGKKHATYYRPLPLKKVGDLYLVQDYYKNGQIQMKAHSTDPRKDIFDGEVIWYYPDGTLNQKIQYTKGLIDGSITTYFPDGTLKTEGLVEKGYFANGTFIGNADNDVIYVYKDKERIEKNYLYAETKTIAERQILKDFDRLEKAIFYDKKGITLGEVTYSNISGMHNSPRTGTEYFFSFTPTQLVKEIIAIGKSEIQNGIVTQTLYLPDGTGLGKGTFGEDGYPHSGLFLNGKGKMTWKEDGIKLRETCCLGNPTIQVDGTYQNGQMYNGSFYSELQNSIEPFVNGVKEGEEIFYDNNFQIIGMNTYSQWAFDGLRITQNPTTKELFEATYVDNVPQDGQVYEFEELITFKNGIMTEKSSYDYLTKELNTTYFYDSDQLPTLKKTYSGDSLFNLEYQGGAPHNGVEVQPFGTVTFENGKYNGPYTIETDQYLEIGNYQDFQKEGEVKFVNKTSGDTTICIYQNNKPYEGIDLTYGEIQYHEGMKEGKFIKTFSNYNYPLDSLSGQFLKDIPIGTFSYYLENDLIGQGEYKNGKPYQGLFFGEDGVSTSEEFYYENGQLVRNVIPKPYNDFTIEKTYQNGLLIRETIVNWKSKDIIYDLELQSGKPLNGTQMVQIPNNESQFWISEYKNGLKSGKEVLVSNPFLEYRMELLTNHYSDGKLDGETIFQSEYPPLTIKGTYQNGLPYSGEIIENDSLPGLLVYGKYQEGELLEKNYLSDNLSEVEIQATLSFKDGKPFSGKEVFKNQRKLVVQEYDQGNLIRSFYNPILNPFQSFETIEHGSDYDSTSYSVTNNYVIHYSNPEKTSGEAIIYDHTFTLAIQRMKFQNNKIIELEIPDRERFNGEKERFYIDNNGNLVNEYKGENFLFQAITVPEIPEPKWLFARNIFSSFESFPSVMIYGYLERNKKPISKLIHQFGKPLSGTMFFPNFENKEVFDFSYFEDGSEKVNLKKLSIKELKDVLKKYPVK